MCCHDPNEGIEPFNATQFYDEPQPSDLLTDLPTALRTYQLAEWNVSRDPDDADLQVDFILARVRWGGAVWRAKVEARRNGR